MILGEMSTSRLLSPSRFSHVSASFSLLLLRGVPEAHLEGHGIPIMVVEEVIEIFMVSLASRNLDATDIRWVLRNYLPALFFLPAFSIVERISEGERNCGDSAGVIFLYCTGR